MFANRLRPKLLFAAKVGWYVDTVDTVLRAGIVSACFGNRVDESSLAQFYNP